MTIVPEHSTGTNTQSDGTQVVREAVDVLLDHVRREDAPRRARMEADAAVPIVCPPWCRSEHADGRPIDGWAMHEHDVALSIPGMPGASVQVVQLDMCGFLDEPHVYVQDLPDGDVELSAVRAFALAMLEAADICESAAWQDSAS